MALVCIGMFSAALFLFLSQTKPQENLSAQRPHASIFNMYVLLTILGQSLVHLVFLGLSVYGAKMFMEEGAELPPKDADFEPNIVNTVAYTVGMLIQVRGQKAIFCMKMESILIWFFERVFYIPLFFFSSYE